MQRQFGSHEAEEQIHEIVAAGSARDPQSLSPETRAEAKALRKATELSLKLAHNPEEEISGLLKGLNGS